MIKIIFAHGENGEFSVNDTMPWERNDKDFEFFKIFTEDCVMVMGRKTFESLPSKLSSKNRTTVVLSNSTDDIRALNGDAPDFVFSNLCTTDVVKALCVTNVDKDICIIGGKGIIEECLDADIADEIMANEIHKHDYYLANRDIERIDLKKIKAYNYNTRTSIDMYDHGVTVRLFSDKK